MTMPKPTFPDPNLRLRRTFSLLCLACLIPGLAQDYYGRSTEWIEKAESLKPELTAQTIRPQALVEMVKDSSAFQGYRAVRVADADSLYSGSFKQIQPVILDFGDHYTGYFAMDLETIHRTSDAPTRFKLTFGEVPAEMATPFDPFPSNLSRGWLQDEVITVMDIPARFELERRMSFRYLKIELMPASPFFDFRISDLSLTAVTSASKNPPELGPEVNDTIRTIDRISLKTLKECMQTVYEDGPKRDRRLWVGDMYLEALANTHSFGNHQLTQRCLYLFAGASDPDGYVLGTIFETPEPHAQEGQRLMDYSLLFNAALLDYLKATGDVETARELWPVAKRQLNIANEYVDDNGLVEFERANREWWVFVDWKEGLHRGAALQGIIIFALNQTYELADMLGTRDEIAHVPSLVRKMKKAAMEYMYNKKTGLFESGDDNQVSYHSQVWMTLAGVPSEKQCRRALTAVLDEPGAVYPGGPYMYHYVVQALVDAGLQEQAISILVSYWGGMADKGADTFWEVYDPEDDFLSPYYFYPMNSYCHAWSCTPSYFIRKYPEIFQY